MRNNKTRLFIVIALALSPVFLFAGKMMVKAEDYVKVTNTPVESTLVSFTGTPIAHPTQPPCTPKVTNTPVEGTVSPAGTSIRPTLPYPTIVLPRLTPTNTPVEVTLAVPSFTAVHPTPITSKTPFPPIMIFGVFHHN